MEVFSRGCIIGGGSAKFYQDRGVQMVVERRGNRAIFDVGMICRIIQFTPLRGGEDTGDDDGPAVE